MHASSVIVTRELFLKSVTWYQLFFLEKVAWCDSTFGDDLKLLHYWNCAV